MIVIDSPKGFRQYGSNVAAPVFKEIADKIYALDLELHDTFHAQAMPSGNFSCDTRQETEKIYKQFAMSLPFPIRPYQMKIG
jgi:hypothetical protein